MTTCPICGERFDEAAHRSPGADPAHAAVGVGGFDAELARCPACGHEFIPAEQGRT